MTTKANREFALKTFILSKKVEIDTAVAQHPKSRAAKDLYEILLSITSTDLVGHGLSQEKLNKFLFILNDMNKIPHPARRLERLTAFAYGQILAAESLSASLKRR